ncbi:MAG TPA: hypothetical protein EYM75_08115 [Dehalococcoidia bacterium]|nr:hypothetical protein [Dehalococcoidia bacterium]
MDTDIGPSQLTVGHIGNDNPGVQPEPAGPPAPAPAAPPPSAANLSAQLKASSFNELVKPSYWKPVSESPNLSQTYSVVRGAVASEQRVTAAVKAQLLPSLPVKSISDDELAAAEGHILNGDVAFCDASIVRSVTEAASMTRCVVTVFSYSGSPFQRARNWYDPRDEDTFDPQTELNKLLESRRNGAFAKASRSELRDRQVMAYMERLTGLDRKQGDLVLHGPMLPMELFAQGDDPEVVAASIDLGWNMLGDPGTLSVVSQTARGDLLTIGMALEPHQYVLLDNYEGFFRRIAGRRYESTKWRGVGKDLSRLAAAAGPSLLIGVLRTEAEAPPRVFHVHRWQCHESAVIAMAACAMEPYRCFPEGTDISDQLSGSYCKQKDVDQQMALAHLDAGAPFAYLRERTTRNQVKGGK